MFSERGKVNLSSGAPAMVITKLVTVGRSLETTDKSRNIYCYKLWNILDRRMIKTGYLVYRNIIGINILTDQATNKNMRKQNIWQQCF